MAAQVDTEQLIKQDEELESGEEQDVSDDGSEHRADGDGNSESDCEGGVDEDQPPPIGVYDHVAPDVDENKEKKGNLCRRGGKAVWACLVGCCHDCKTMDKVIFAFHILLILAGLAVGTVTTLSKMSTHNQCYLKAHYHSDGSMDYSHNLYWCDSLLYDALVTMSLAFLFIMVNWTAQLNKNAWWMWIKLGLHVAGWLLQVGSGVMLLIAFFNWCTSMESAMSADDDSFPAKEDENKCLRAARYFDEDKNEESTLTHLYSFTLLSLGVALFAGVLWTITLVLAIAHFCEYLYRKQDEHEDQEDDDYHLEDGDSSDEEEGYQYPPYDENLVRQRRNIAGGYNLNLQDGDEGAVGGAVGGTGLLQRDIAA